MLACYTHFQRLPGLQEQSSIPIGVASIPKGPSVYALKAHVVNSKPSPQVDDTGLADSHLEDRKIFCCLFFSVINKIFV